MSTSMNANALEGLAPIYSIVCHDEVSEFISEKAKHQHPATTIDSADKVSNCVRKCSESVKATPCSSILDDFRDCLSQEAGRVPCKSLKVELEECTAKHYAQF